MIIFIGACVVGGSGDFGVTVKKYGQIENTLVFPNLLLHYYVHRTFAEPNTANLIFKHKWKSQPIIINLME